MKLKFHKCKCVMLFVTAEARKIFTKYWMSITTGTLN